MRYLSAHQDLDTARRESAGLKEQLERSWSAGSRARSEGATAAAAAGAARAAASKAANEANESRSREGHARAQLTELERALARERSTTAQRLREADETKKALQARVDVAEAKVLEEVNRARAKAEEVARQKDEAVGYDWVALAARPLVYM